jgi:hypothetical protein
MNAQDKIKELAYQLWQDAGSPHGRDMDFWLAAEAQLKTARAAEPKAAKPKAPAKAKAPAKPKAPAKAKAPAKPKAPAKA